MYEIIINAMLYHMHEDPDQLETSVGDEGGPTRFFLDEFARQLDLLKVEVNGKTTKLWERNSVGGALRPVGDLEILHGLGLITNTDIDTTSAEYRSAWEKVEKKVRPLARAVGRVLFFCMANRIDEEVDPQFEDDEKTQRHQFFYIDQNVLPDIYTRHLLMEQDPTDTDYAFDDLMEFLLEHRLGEDLKGKNKTELNYDDIEAKLAYFVDPDGKPVLDGKSLEQQRTIIRQAAETFFIDNRQLALRGLREGLLLDSNIGGMSDALN